MPVVDDQGRLFGRINLVDAVLLVLAVGLVPLAYGAYWLFRTPTPRLTAVVPSTLVAGPHLRVTVRGENLRPYMRVSFGNIQGATFLFASTTEAEVDLNEMPPGLYDVVLYDFAQEQHRLPKALTILPSPLPETRVVAVGGFLGLTRAQAAAIRPGQSVPGLGEIVQVGAPVPDVTRVLAGPVLEIPRSEAVRLPVAIRIACFLRAPQGTPQCAVGDVVLQQTAVLFGDTPEGRLVFQIDQVRGPEPLERVRAVVRFSGPASVVGRVRTGDVDRGEWLNELAAGAHVTDVGAVRAASGGSVERDVSLTIDAQRGSRGWLYAQAPLRVGAQLRLRTPDYDLSGIVLDVTPRWSDTAAR